MARSFKSCVFGVMRLLKSIIDMTFLCAHDPRCFSQKSFPINKHLFICFQENQITFDLKSINLMSLSVTLKQVSPVFVSIEIQVDGNLRILELGREVIYYKRAGKKERKSERKKK